MNKEANYTISIKGHLPPHWSNWFDDMTIRLEPNGTTTLHGPVIDQAALFGLLTKVRDLRLPLLTVACDEAGPKHCLSIVVEPVAAPQPQAQLHLTGPLTAETYPELVATAHNLIHNGYTSLVLNLRGVSALSAAGLVALHKIDMLLRGESAPDLEAGWEAIHAITRRSLPAGPQPLTLLDAEPGIGQILQNAGLAALLVSSAPVAATRAL